MQEIVDPEQLKALAHPLRQRLLYALGDEPRTMAQLAAEFTENKGNIGHHLKVLHAAGLVHIVETRQVRGGTEHHYRRTAQRVYVGGPPGATTTAMLQAVAEELTATDKEPLLILRHVRLNEEQTERLKQALNRIVEEAQDNGPGAQRHAVLVGLYEC